MSPKGAHEKVRNAQNRLIALRPCLRVTAEGEFTCIIERVGGEILGESSKAMKLKIELLRTKVSKRERHQVVPVAYG